MLKVNDDFKKLIPPLSDEEFRQLEENILKEGCRDVIVIWDNTILDGHNRYNICNKYSLPFKTYEMQFDCIDDAMDWMDKNQLGRRNLTPDQRHVIIGRRYNREKLKNTEKGNQYTKTALDQNDTKHTADRIAKDIRTIGK